MIHKYFLKRLHYCYRSYYDMKAIKIAIKTPLFHNFHQAIKTSHRQSSDINLHHR